MTELALERKADNPTILNVTGMTSVADYFLILSSVSPRQVKALANALLTEAKAGDATVLGREGVDSGKWALLDFGDIVLHIFQAPVREFYDLEGLWADAPRIDVEELVKESPADAAS